MLIEEEDNIIQLETKLQDCDNRIARLAEDRNEVLLMIDELT